MTEIHCDQCDTKVSTKTTVMYSAVNNRLANDEEECDFIFCVKCYEEFISDK